MGLCLPEACDSLALFSEQAKAEAPQTSGPNKTELLLEEIRRRVFKLIGFNLPTGQAGMYSREQLKLIDVFCLPQDSHRHLAPGAYLFLAFLASWLLLVGLCTRLRSSRRALMNGRNGGEISPRQLSWIKDDLVECLALESNLHSLAPKTNNKPEPIVNLNFLDSVKHLGCVGVVMAHVLLTYLTLGTSYSHTIEQLGRDMRTMLLLSLNNVVDTFFVISGILVSYLIFKKIDTTRLENPTAQSDSDKKETAKETSNHRWSGFVQMSSIYFKVVVGRYLRMAPLYFLVYAFVKTLSVHLGSGPLWDYATNEDSLRGLCRRESWWWAIFFLSDFKPIIQHCVPPAWSLAADLQFFTLVPLLVALLRLGNRNRLLRISTNLLMGTLVVISAIITIIQYKSLLDYVSLRDFARLRLHVFTVLIRHAAHAYSQPQNRIGPMLIGLIGGHQLYEYEKRVREAKGQNNAQGPNSNLWPFWMRGRWFRCTILLGLLFLLAPCVVQMRERARKSINNQEQILDLGIFDAGIKRLIQSTIESILFLKTSTKFDCYLALGGFVLIKPLWSICNCIVFLRYMTDLGGTLVGRLMSLSGWQYLSKLNYCILLIHFELIAYESMSRLTVAQPTTWSYLMCKFAFAYLFSLLFAGLIYVLFEQPANRLIGRYLLHSNGKREQRPQLAAG